MSPQCVLHTFLSLQHVPSVPATYDQSPHLKLRENIATSKRSFWIKYCWMSVSQGTNKQNATLTSFWIPRQSEPYSKLIGMHHTLDRIPLYFYPSFGQGVFLFRRNSKSRYLLPLGTSWGQFYGPSHVLAKNIYIDQDRPLRNSSWTSSRVPVLWKETKPVSTLIFLW